jgi:hypothetical protein
MKTPAKGKLHLSIQVTNELGVTTQTEMEVDVPVIPPDDKSTNSKPPPVITIPVDKAWFAYGSPIEREV